MSCGDFVYVVWNQDRGQVLLEPGPVLGENRCGLLDKLYELTIGLVVWRFVRMHCCIYSLAEIQQPTSAGDG